MPDKLAHGARLLLQAARGQYLPASAVSLPSSSNVSPPPPLPASQPLRCFPLRQEHVGSLSKRNEKDPATPRDFHSHLCQMMRGAKHRVQLASLYIGAASSYEYPRERELLDALSEAASRPELNVTVLLDENRALRRVPRKQDNTVTCSAEAVHKCMEIGRRKTGRSAMNGVFLFQTLSAFKKLLPSPLNEAAGVFHIKAYVVDDSLILSGANLSEEYFEDRQDRYMLFEGGGGGLVDFYSRLVEILCQYARPYQGGQAAATAENDKDELLESLSKLFDGKDYEDLSAEDDTETIGYAIPTFQAPKEFSINHLAFPSDIQVTRNLLLTALEQNPASVVRLSSAYLNPTPSLMSVLARFGTLPCRRGTFGAAHLLTAGGTSHGFAPKEKKTANHGSGRDWIPWVFSEFTREAAHHIVPNGGKVLLYERPDWTFHSKGLWLSMPEEKQIHDEAATTENEPTIADATNLVAGIVGSGNYGARSEDLDLESNCIIILPRRSPLQETMAHEWNYMCKYATEWDVKKQTETNQRPPSFPLRAALPYIRNLF